MNFGINSWLMSFGRCIAALTATAWIGIGTLQAQTTFNLATWEMRVPFPTGTGLAPTGTTYLPPNQTGTAQWPTTGIPYPAGTPTAGIFAGDSAAILSTFHSSTAATYTSPAGNGSQYSFSSNNWAPNDYYQVVLPSTGWTNLAVSWDQARSSTGPSAFALQMSTNGTDFTQLTTYSVLQSGGGGAPGTWSTTTYLPLYSSTFALPVEAENQSSLYLRFTNVTGSASSAAGSNRIDNISVTAVPEPSAIALAAMGLAAGGLFVRRRRPV